MQSAARMVFTGHFAPASFAAFVQDRGQRLALATVIEAIDPACVAVRVSGQPGLVDAFEMACSLGPLDCLVLDVARDEVTP